MNMLEAALDYVDQGFRVFPVKPDKTPYTKNGLKDATGLRIGVEELWKRWPAAGIGLVTDNLVVLDFDVKNNGLESKADMEARFGALPRTRSHRTGGGGLHLIYRNPNGSNARNAVAVGGFPGVDLRANGGYICVPPSLHESGKRYEVIDDHEIAPAPEWLMVLASKQRGGAWNEGKNFLKDIVIWGPPITRDTKPSQFHHKFVLLTFEGAAPFGFDFNKENLATFITNEIGHTSLGDLPAFPLHKVIETTFGNILGSAFFDWLSTYSHISSIPQMMQECIIIEILSRDTEQPIPEGQRDATLASLAGTMRRRGLPQAAIEAALLEVNRLQCQPPLPESDVTRIASSISRYPPEPKTEQTEQTGKTLNKLNKAQKTEQTEVSEQTEQTAQASQGKIIWRLVDVWLLDHQGEKFDLDTICRHLDMKTREQRQHVAKKLAYEVGHKKLEKLNIGKGSLYRYIDNTYVSIDWLNASPSPPLAIKWPYGIDDNSHFGFDGHVVISPGDVIVVAGVSNMGKTAICLNLLWNNMDAFPCTLMGNEYEAGKFKRRISRMHWANPISEDGKPKFELIERYENWKDIIRPDNINIIDWIELPDNFYQIGSIIEGIKTKLRNGIAVISLQKSSGKELGLGGGFSQHIASLYLAIDFERLTVVKAKEWYEVNPNGKMYGFQITDSGTKFEHIREVRICIKCGGTGKVQFGKCQICGGRGFVDL